MVIFLLSPSNSTPTRKHAPAHSEEQLEKLFMWSEQPPRQSAITPQTQLGNYGDSGHFPLAGRLEELIRLRADNIPHTFVCKVYLLSVSQ